MKTVILSYGHLDAVLPLYKHLNELVDIDLVLVFSQRAKRESLLNFMDLDIKDGFLNEKITKIILSRIGIGDCYPKIQIFIYHNNRIRSIKNTILSFQLARTLSKYKMIHMNGLHTTFTPLYYFIPQNTKKVFTIHDFKPHSGEAGKYSIFGCYWRNKFLLKRKWPIVIQNKADFNLVKSEFPNASEKIHFIPLGVFENYRYWSDKKNNAFQYDVLFFGRISPYKGICYLLEAIKKMQQQNAQVSLCIAGSGSLTEYDSEIRSIKNLTVFNEYIESPRLVELIQKSKIVVCPYTDATQSGVAMTSFALNTPVIAADVGGFPDVVIDGVTGYLIRPKDSDHLAETIERLVNDEITQYKIQESIASLTDNPDYNWNKIARKYIDLYKTI